ncbi:hypothetical protein BH20BAC1_BH20BAC1_08680 [soil metagenome]
MRLFQTFVLAVLLSTAVHGQAPMQINYQGIARSNSGSPLTNQNMGLRLSILEGSATGALVYQETRDIRTDKFGMFVVAIGSTGTLTTISSLPLVNWTNSVAKYLKVEISTKNNSSYTNMGAAELLSVPFAFSASAARPVGAAGGSLSGAYPNPSIADDVITENMIVDGAVTSAKLAPGVIPSGLPPSGNAGGGLSGTYPNPSLANNAVTNNKIADGAVTSAKLASGVIPATLPPSGNAGGSLTGTYPNPSIANNAVTGNKIADGAVTSAKLASGVIPTTLPPSGNAGGELTGTYPNPSIANNAITGNKIADSSITLAKLAPGVIPANGGSSGNAGGDLGGIFPNPNVLKIRGRELSDQAPSAGQVLKFNGTQWTPAVDITGNITLPFVSAQSSAFTLFSVVNQGTGSALSGTNITQNPSVAGIIGKISSTSPGDFSSGVRGINNSTSEKGYGVWGSHSGSGYGIYGTSASGDGVNANSAGGNGVYAKSSTGNGIFATSDEGIPAMFDISNVNSWNDALFTSNSGGGNGLTSVANVGHGMMGIANDTYGMGVIGINNAGGEAVFGFTISDVGSAVVGRNDGPYAAVRGFNTSDNGVGVLALANSWGTTGGTALVAELEGANPGNTAVFKSNGANVARIDATGKGFFNGGTQMSGADVAEYFAVEGNHAGYEPGDVLAISETSDRKVEKSSAPYSTLVAGVYATKPGLLLTEENAVLDMLDQYVPMGVVGVLPTKVCLEGGEIKRGDLLVTSSKNGVAMKADPSKVQIGQVLGKALQPYSSNSIGKINVLVSVK